MSGDHVALLHARPFVSWYEPLVVALPGYSVLRTAEQCPPRSDFGLGDDADVCARLLHHVGFDHPHVVGHSYGGCLALELARQIVALRSIALLEPATSGLLDPEEAIAGLAQLMELYRARGPVVAAEQSSGSSSATTLASGAGTGDPVLSAQRQQGVALAIEGLLGSKLGGAAWARGRWSNDQVIGRSDRRVPRTDRVARRRRGRRVARHVEHTLVKSERTTVPTTLSPAFILDRHRPVGRQLQTGSSDGYLDGRPRKARPSGVTSERGIHRVGQGQ